MQSAASKSGTIRGADSTPTGVLFAFRPALDGLRALAVLPVLLYHGELEFASGGFLGVDLFFVISGYLITTLLLREASRTGTIQLGAFWGRRARRLFPALFVVLVCVLFYGLIASKAELARMSGDVFSTLAYVANWWFAFSGESYFDQFARPSMLRHTWSLAIEEQFYVVWPLLFWWGIRGALGRPRIWLAGALLGAIASAALMSLLFEAGTDPSRVYYGTDTRAQALLIGVALAFLLVHVPDDASTGDAEAQPWSKWVGALGILSCLGLFHGATDSAGWMYRGGYLFMAMASAGAVAGAVLGRRDSGLVRLLSWSPLLWIGARSYGLYVWHWPVFVFLDADRLGLEASSESLLAIRFIVTFGLAALSFRYIESPIRRGAWTPRRQRHALVAGLVTIVAATPLVTHVFAPSTDMDPTTGTSSKADSPASHSDLDTLRVLIVGDSVALTLALQHPETIDGKTKLVVRGSTLLGCGITRGDILLDNASVPYLRRCDERPANWVRVTEEFVPDVTVILLGAWEVYDRRLDGQSLMLGSAAHRDDLIERLEQGVDLLRGDGRPVFLLTVPCYKNRLGRQRRLWRVRNDPNRWRTLNQVYRIAESRFPDKMRLVDLAGLVCPDGSYQPTLDGIALHEDGVHYTLEGAHRVWAWLGPQLVDAVEE